MAVQKCMLRIRGSQHGNGFAGQNAAEALRKKIGSSSVQCKVRAKDLYGRNVSSCSLPGTGDIGDWLVSNGYAVAYRYAIIPSSINLSLALIIHMPLCGPSAANILS